MTTLKFKSYNSSGTTVDASYSDLSAYASKNNINLSDCSGEDLSFDSQQTCKIEKIQKHMRDNIDRKVAEIYQAEGTNARSFDENYRNTLLVGTVWAMLGTVVLYYTFKNV